MDPDGMADDQLYPRQADPIVRDGRQAEDFLRVRDVQHDLGPGAVKLAQIDLPNAELEPTTVDIPGIALCARDSNLLPVRYHLCTLFGPDDRRYPQLTADNGCVRGPPTAIGDDRSRLLHDRYPVRIGLISHQNLTLVEPFHVA